MLNDPGQADRRSRGIPVVPVFDGYRAVAIFGIVIFHLFAAGPGGDRLFRLENATFGHLIDVLFIVSGFVVFLPTVAQGRFGSIRAYAIRRVARLFPAYYLILFLTLMIGVIGPPLSPHFHQPAADILIHLTGFQTFGAYLAEFGPVGFGINGPVWTLSVEISFYIVLPLAAMSFLRYPRTGLLVAAIVAVGWAWAGTHPWEIADLIGRDLDSTTAGRIARATGTQFPFWAFSFALGMAGARLYMKATREMEPGLVRRYAGWAQIAGLIGLCFAVAGAYGVEFTSGEVFLLAEKARTEPAIMLGYSASLATLMVATALGPQWTRRPFDNRLIRWLAEISYGVYLSHMLLVWIAFWGFGFRFGESIPSFLAWVGGIGSASILYGYLSARFLEQPIRRWARKYGREPSFQRSQPDHP